MRIAIVNDAWSPQVNGVVTTLSRTVSTLVAEGHERAGRLSGRLPDLRVPDMSRDPPHVAA